MINSPTNPNQSIFTQAVEICHPELNAWYPGRILDVVDSQTFKVRFEDSYFTSEEQVNEKQVRWRAATQADSNPAIGEEVEVLSKRPDEAMEPLGWRQGIMANRTKAHATIEFEEGAYPDILDHIVPIGTCRPVPLIGGPSIQDFDVFYFQLPVELHQWARNFHTMPQQKQDEFRLRLDKVAQNSKVKSISFDKADCTRLAIAGKKDNQKRVFNLLEIVISKEVEIAQMEQETQHRMQEYETLKQKQMNEQQFVHDCVVPSNLIGLLVGQGGKNIRDIFERHNAQVYIDKNDKEANQNVRVVARNQQDLENAVQEVEIREFRLPVKQEHVDYICGENGKNLADLRTRSNLYQAAMRERNDRSWYLNVIGHEDCIQQFKDSLAIHLDYFEPLKQREYQRTTLNESRKVFQEEYGAVIEKPTRTRGGWNGGNSSGPGMRMTRGGHRGGVAPGTVEQNRGSYVRK